MDPRIIAIRSDRLVGRDTCSVVDECMSDDELLKQINDADHIIEYGIEPLKAVKWARMQEELHLEQALNYRWGEDDDPQIVAMNNWRNSPGRTCKCKDYPSCGH